MSDIFENIIFCKDCKKRMMKKKVDRNGFHLRALECPKCKKKIFHPSDLEEYHKFKQLRSKPFRVKLRIVGNSYAISIPKEIVEFIKEEERKFNDMVRLCLEETNRLSLFFGENFIKGKLNKR